MPKALFAAPLLAALALPVQAQSAGEDIWADDPYAETDELVVAIDGIMDVLLDLPVGRIADAVPEADLGHEVRPDDTLRSLGTREDPAFEERVRGGARMMTGMATEMIGRLADLLPELEAIGARIEGALPPAR